MGKVKWNLYIFFLPSVDGELLSHTVQSLTTAHIGCDEGSYFPTVREQYIYN